MAAILSRERWDKDTALWYSFPLLTTIIACLAHVILCNDIIAPSYLGQRLVHTKLCWSTIWGPVIRLPSRLNDHWQAPCGWPSWSRCLVGLMQHKRAAVFPFNFYTPCFNKVERGYTGFALSFSGQNHVCSIASIILARSISYLHMLSSNFRRCVMCKVFMKLKNLKFLSIACTWFAAEVPQCLDNGGCKECDQTVMIWLKHCLRPD